MEDTPFHDAYRLSTDQLPDPLRTDPEQGLDAREAEARRHEYGSNRLRQGETVSVWVILLRNVHNIIVYLLLAASIVSFLTQDTVEGIAVLIAVLIAVVFGFITEYRAQKSVEALQKMMHGTAKVLRSGQMIQTDAAEVVPGDIIYLEEGDAVPADARLLSTRSFACIESALTGESESVSKDAGQVYREEVPLGDRKNSVYAGTAVTRGNAYAVVTAIGMQTEMGRISEMLTSRKKETTPLNRELDRLGRMLIGIAAVSSVLVVLLGLLTRQELPFVIQVAIILAIAAVPESLPAVSTISLARGMRRMARHNALVRSLPAVETLGSTSVIYTDKTGTLTENQMTVRQILLEDGSLFRVEGTGYRPEGDILSEESGAPVIPEEHPDLEELLRAAVLCSNATLQQSDGSHQVIGDPTEGALVVLGKKAELSRTELEKNGWKRIGEMPFDSRNRYMVTIHERDGERRVFIKGAPDALLTRSEQPEGVKTLLRETQEAWSNEGQRVLAIGVVENYHGDGEDPTLPEGQDSVRILGLTGMLDPPRDDVREAIRECREASVRVCMVTGDHPKTASVIAGQIGLADHDRIMTGQELDGLSQGTDETDRRIADTAVFARVSPENKLQIVDAAQRSGLTVAMTGDGVNDAPALNGSDIGVAMGIRGTEVAKEAADMVLTDDRFSTIVHAIREGRVLFSNIRKFVFFLFSCNFVEITAILLAMALLLPVPVLPLQILWLNLVTDVTPALSLSYEPAETHVMQQPPRRKGQGLLAPRFIALMAVSGAIMGLLSFVVFYLILHQTDSTETARTAAFTAMSVMQLLHVLNVRRDSSFGADRTLRKNPYLVGAVALSLLLQVAVVYLPFMQNVMDTVPLDASAWLVIGSATVAATGAVYLAKRLIRRDDASADATAHSKQEKG